MTRSIARTVALAALVVAQGCVVMFKRGGQPELLRGARNRTAGAASTDRTSYPGFGPKPVQGKEPPTRLIARDGTYCVVMKSKFESTVLGTSVWCTWIDR